MSPLEQINLYGLTNHFNELKSLYDNKNLPNKILLTGSKGLGKFTLSLHFINYVLSKNESYPYDLENFRINENNRSFKLVNNNSSSNLYLIDVQKDKKNIEINQIRELINFCNKSSFNNKPRFILIDNLELMNLNSNNALLRTLEEPNDNIYFILINNSQKILPTIKSRCLSFRISLSQKEIKDYIFESVIRDVLPSAYLTKETKIHINPTGSFEIGGPVGDCGLTGRKIIVDTYGGMARHGGGAFSGKDPSKVDRSAAYAARYVAKNIVAAGLAQKCEIQISYAIGVAEPTSLSVDTFGTATIDEAKIVQIINEVFDLRPWGITNMLNLLRPIYKDTASYGHFGRADLDLSWEKIDKIENIKSLI